MTMINSHLTVSHSETYRGPQVNISELSCYCHLSPSLNNFIIIFILYKNLYHEDVQAKLIVLIFVSLLFSSVLNDTEERLMQCSIHEAMSETLESGLLPSIDQKHSYGLEFKKPTAHPAKKTHVKSEHKSKPSGMFKVGSPGNLSPVMQRHRPHHHKVHVKTQPTASDADPMFALDGFTDDCEPFFESEEEDLSSGKNIIII